MALASVAVPTVERGLAPSRSWSTMIAVVRPSRRSTSGRDRLGMKPCTKALYVSLISRCDSAAIVSNTSELLPEPETPVNAVSRRFGISMLTSLRLFSRAPCTRIWSWLSAAWTLLIVSPSVSARGTARSHQPPALAHELAVGQLVHLAPGLHPDGPQHQEDVAGAAARVPVCLRDVRRPQRFVGRHLESLVEDHLDHHRVPGLAQGQPGHAGR